MGLRFWRSVHRRFSPGNAPLWWRLGGILLLGAGLRLGFLGSKALWLDEIITALIALGQGFRDIPLGTVLTGDTLYHFFQLQDDRSWGQVIQMLTTESTHPPLYFCLLQSWLELVFQGDRLGVALRSFSAWVGVLTIALGYGYGRRTFSERSGLAIAGLFALSPFGVYLSQEARHYSLAIALIMVGLVLLQQLQRDLVRGQWRWGVGLAWGVVQGAAIYTHYFSLLAFGAQALSLVIWWLWRQNFRPWRSPLGIWWGILSALGMPLVLLGPWLPTWALHLASDKTSWLPEPSLFSPLYQTLMATLLMVVAGPVEGVPGAIAVVSGFLMLACFGLWMCQLGSQWPGFWRRYPDEAFLLVGFVALGMGSILAIAYGFGKDLTVAPRYGFIYFPGVICLWGGMMGQWQWGPQAVKNQSQDHRPRNAFQTMWYRRPGWIWGIALVGCLWVNGNFIFQKPYRPAQVTAAMAQAEGPVLLAIAAQDTSELAFALSYSYAFTPPDQPVADRASVILDRGATVSPWAQLANLGYGARSVWVVFPGLARGDFPPVVALGDRRCHLDPEGFGQIGFPYQRYHCGP